MTVRWGVLGAGAIAERAMLRAIGLADGASLAAIASRDAERAGRLAAAFGVERVHATYDDLLADPSIDAVYVALANDAHAPRSIDALSAGKHVLCEKPLAPSVAEVDAMTAAADAAGRLLVEAAWYRWHPRIRLVERLLREFDVLRAVQYVTAGFTFAGVPADNYRLDPAKGGGALYDVGCYAVSAAVWAFGQQPREVSCQAVIGDTGVDLTAEVRVTFDSGVADLRCSIAEEPRQWLVIAGERGELDVREAAFTAWEGQETELWFTSPAGSERDPVPAANAYALMVEQMSAVVEGRDGWVVPLAESRTVAQVLDAAFESAAAGTPVAI
jgi:predicted dehydrogenase